VWIACRERLPLNSSCVGALHKGAAGVCVCVEWGGGRVGEGRHQSGAICKAAGDQGVVRRLLRLYVCWERRVLTDDDHPLTFWQDKNKGGGGKAGTHLTWADSSIQLMHEPRTRVH
jgi:hypothetical protein